MTFHVLAPSVSNSTKSRMSSRNRSGAKTPSIMRSSCGRACSAGSSLIVFHSAKCSAGVVIVPTTAFMRSVTPTISTKRYSGGIVCL